MSIKRVLIITGIHVLNIKLSYNHIFGVYLQFVRYLIYILHDYCFVYRILVDV